MTIERASPLTEFVGKLERRGALPPDASAAFHSLPHTVSRFLPGDMISEEGSDSKRSFFVSSGFISRQKKVKASARIVGVGIPGDAVDLQSLWFHQCDHSLFAHSASTLISVEHRDIIELCKQSPAITKALWHDTLVDAAIFREWALNIGHRPAKLRLGHFLLELGTRLKSHGLISEDVFELPFTQSDIASALGLSLVHTNKSLKALRQDQLVQMSGRQVSIINRPALEDVTGFDPGYLHTNDAPKVEP